MLERRGELLEQLGKLGKFRLAMAERRRGLALEAGETVDHVHRVVGAAVLAFICHVDAVGALLSDHVVDRLAHREVERGAVGIALLLGEQLRDHGGRARQAAGVGGDDPLRAAQHFRSLPFAVSFALSWGAFASRPSWDWLVSQSATSQRVGGSDFLPTLNAEPTCLSHRKPPARCCGAWISVASRPSRSTAPRSTMPITAN